MARSLSVFVAVLLVTSAQTPRPEPPADLVLRGGRIVTLDDRHPNVEALAIRSDTIAAIGSERDIQPYIGTSTRLIDLKGALATPGFIDAHVHFTGVGEAARNLKLSTARTWNDIVQMVADAARKARPGEWILGRGWHQEKWTEVPSPNVDGFPLHEALSRVSPDNPVWLTHAGGHAGFANAVAMKMAEVQKTTADPPGGQILERRAGQSDRPVQRTRASLDYRRPRTRPGDANGGAGRSGSAAGHRARVARDSVEGAHDGERCWFAPLDHRRHEEGGGRGATAGPRLDDAARTDRTTRRRRAEVSRRQLW
jgi:hypothetical protein